MNSIYLYIHRIMIRAITPHLGNIGIKSDSIDSSGMLTRKHALWIIGRYLKFTRRPMNEAMLEDMINLKLLKKVDRFRVQIINQERSEPQNLDSGILVKLLEAGEK